MKKLLALVLCLSMVFGLVACGSGNEQPQSTQSQSTNTQAGETTQIGTPEEPVTVKVVVKDVFPTEEDVINLCAAINEKMAEQGMYVDVQFVEPPASDYATAMPLAVMNGETEADIIYFQGGDKPLADQVLL